MLLWFDEVGEDDDDDDEGVDNSNGLDCVTLCVCVFIVDLTAVDALLDRDMSNLKASGT